MKKYGILLWIILSIISCIKRLEKPENLLSKKQMSDILIDIGLSKNIPHNVLDTLVKNTTHKADKRLLKILDKNKIPLKRFTESHRYYTLYPEEYKLIFKIIKDSLKKELTQLKLEDSLAKKNKKIEKIEPQKVLEKTDRQKEDSIMKPINKKLDSLRK